MYLLVNNTQYVASNKPMKFHDNKHNTQYVRIVFNTAIMTELKAQIDRDWSIYTKGCSFKKSIFYKLVATDVLVVISEGVNYRG